jgi:hypothetical protein
MVSILTVLAVRMLTIIFMKNGQFIKTHVIEKLGGIKAAKNFFRCAAQSIYMWPEGEPIRRQG